MIIKDINGRPIKELERFTFDYLSDLHLEPKKLTGSFDWSQEELRYEIDILGDDDYICLSYVPGAMRNFKNLKK